MGRTDGRGLRRPSRRTSSTRWRARTAARRRCSSTSIRSVSCAAPGAPTPTTAAPLGSTSTTAPTWPRPSSASPSPASSDRPELAETSIPLEAEVAVLPCRGVQLPGATTGRYLFHPGPRLHPPRFLQRRRARLLRIARELNGGVPRGDQRVEAFVAWILAPGLNRLSHRHGPLQNLLDPGVHAQPAREARKGRSCDAGRAPRARSMGLQTIVFADLRLSAGIPVTLSAPSGVP